MPIKVKSSIKLDKVQQDLQENLRRELEVALIDETQVLVSRTQSGIDVKGRAFKPYDPDYKRFKERRGRNATPDLVYTGNMLQSITSAVQSGTKKLIGKIFFSSAKEAKKAEYNLKTRSFFGLSEEQIKRIMNRLKQAMRK